MSLTVTLDTAAFANALAALKRPGLDTAVAAALRDTLNQGRNKAATLVAKQMGVRVGTVKPRIYVPDFIKEGSYEAHITASRKPIPLIDFPVKQTREGVSTRAWGKPQVIRHAFIATMKTGHRGVFVRVNKDRLPIKQLWGPTIWGTFTMSAVTTAIAETIKTRMGINLARRVRAQVRRGKQKGGKP